MRFIFLLRDLTVIFYAGLPEKVTAANIGMYARKERLGEGIALFAASKMPAPQGGPDGVTGDAEYASYPLVGPKNEPRRTGKNVDHSACIH
jgi:hypothetical protein